MKKFLLILPILALLAAGCNSSSTTQQTQNTGTQQQQVAQTPTPTPTQSQTAISNIFTYIANPGDKVGGMVLDKISHATDNNIPADADHVYAEFSGTITLTGRLAAPTGNPEDAGMGPQYSLNDLTKESLNKLPYLQSDTRTVWFGVKNPAVMQNFSVKNGDQVQMTISKYEYNFFPAGVWNQADVISITKIY